MFKSKLLSVLLTLGLVIFILVIKIPSTDTNFFTKNPKSESIAEELDKNSCFCQLQGDIDDCLCQIETVDKFNNFKIYPVIQSILQKDYFRYYQVNLKKNCPFWPDDGACSLKSCQVKVCKEDEVPAGLKGDNGKIPRTYFSTSHLNEIDNTCNETEDLGYINTTLSSETKEGFERWKMYDESLVDFCSTQDDPIETGLTYVDLHLNPERYTGYNGPSAHRIWNSIYSENCFRDAQMRNLIMEPFESFNVDESCIEKRTFYRAISGLHASINIHLSAKYLLTEGRSKLPMKGDDDANSKEWGPNLDLFKKHFDPHLTNGQSHTWLKNLYFLYLLELKAIRKMSSFFLKYDLYTGNVDEDADVKSAIEALLRAIDNFPHHFEEKALFSGKDAAKLKAEFHQRFTNITQIMDCVGCQKCKLWGKLQIKGLGTALKVLFSDAFNNKIQADFISRSDIVSLINAFGRLSESIYELENFRNLLIQNEGGNLLNSGAPHIKSLFPS